MKIFTAEQVHQTLSYPEFLDTLASTFGGNFTMPPRQLMPLAPESPGHDAFAMLPAWNDEVIALKAFTYFPENQAPDLTVYAQILLFDRKNGAPLALVDGTSVTYRRTAGVSALASRFLSRADSEEMLLINTGRLAPFLIDAHASVRPLKRIRIWGRNAEKAKQLAHILGDLAMLCRGEAPKRPSDHEITLFKSVGSALGDLAGARAVWEAAE